MVGIRIKNIILELARRDILKEHHIKLSISPPLRLRQAEEAVDNARDREAKEDKRQLPAQISLVRVNRIRDAHAACHVHGLVDADRDGGRLGTESSGGDLGEDDEAERADGQVVEEVVDQHHGALRPDHARGARDDVEDADQEDEDGEEHEAVVEDLAPAPAGYQQPREDGAHPSDCQHADAEVERVVGVEPGELEEVHAVPRDQVVAGEGLDGVDDCGDGGSAKVAALETVGPRRGLCGLLF